MNPSMLTGSSLVIAFCYESFVEYRACGYSIEECAEFDTDETLDAVESSLISLGHKVIRIGDIKQLIERLARGQYLKWDLAFSISEGIYGTAREAQIPGLFEAYRIPHVFSDAATLALCHDKARTKMILECNGIPTAPFAVAPKILLKNDKPRQRSAAEIIKSSRHSAALQQYPLFLKPSCEGSSKGIYSWSKVNDPEELEISLRMLQNRFHNQSILIERFLSGNEYTVSIIGTGDFARVLGVIHQGWRTSPVNMPLDVTQCKSPSSHVANLDFFASDMKAANKEMAPKQIFPDRSSSEVQAAERVALETWKTLECYDIGRVDIRFDTTNSQLLPCVLEVNPLPGLCPNWSALVTTAIQAKMSHRDIIESIIRSAASRYI